MKFLLFTLSFLSSIFLSPKLYADIVDYEIYSQSMHKYIPVRIALPFCKNAEDSANTWPVVYLLHGYSGDFTTWSRVIQLQQYANTYHCIIVTPDGGFNSWYINSSLNKKNQYESFITSELLHFVDSAYKTIKTPQGRAIAGFSMGGHGAFTLLCKHLNLYGAAGSMAGILDLTDFKDQWELKQALGLYSQQKQNWKKNNFANLLAKLKGQEKVLVLSVGKQDFTYAQHQRLKMELGKAKIPFTYNEVEANHGYEFCKLVIDQQFQAFHTMFSTLSKYRAR